MKVAATRKLDGTRMQGTVSGRHAPSALLNVLALSMAVYQRDVTARENHVMVPPLLPLT